MALPAESIQELYPFFKDMTSPQSTATDKQFRNPLNDQANLAQTSVNVLLANIASVPDDPTGVNGWTEDQKQSLTHVLGLLGSYDATQTPPVILGETVDMSTYQTIVQPQPFFGHTPVGRMVGDTALKGSMNYLAGHGQSRVDRLWNVMQYTRGTTAFREKSGTGAPIVPSIPQSVGFGVSSPLGFDYGEPTIEGLPSKDDVIKVIGATPPIPIPTTPDPCVDLFMSAIGSLTGGASDKYAGIIDTIASIGADILSGRFQDRINTWINDLLSIHTKILDLVNAEIQNLENSIKDLLTSAVMGLIPDFMRDPCIQWLMQSVGLPDFQQAIDSALSKIPAIPALPTFQIPPFIPPIPTIG